MPATKKTSKTSKIVDVAPPGQTPPPANSKSVIIPRRSVLQNAASLDGVSQASPESSPAHSPVGGKTHFGVVPAPTAPAPAQTAESLVPAAPTETEPAANDGDDGQVAEAAEVAMPAAEAAPTGTDTASPDRQAELAAAIDSKRYYLPITTAEATRSKRFIISGCLLSLVLALAWLDIALDAGLIRLGGLHAVTHFFH